MGKDQFALALDGIEDTAYAYSFMATNEEPDLDEEIAQAEWEFRRRTKVEELFRDTAHGTGLSHLPSGSHAVNSMWMWGALLAYNLSAWLQMLAPLGATRRRIATVRRLLIARAALESVQQAGPEYRRCALAMLARTPEVEAEAKRAYDTEQGRRQHRRYGPIAVAAATKAAEQARERTAQHLLATRLEQLRDLTGGRADATAPAPWADRLTTLAARPTSDDLAGAVIA